MKLEAPAKTCKLSIIIPVYNEWKTIAELLNKLTALRLEKEIIVVDDGSSDGTTEILKSVQHPLVRVFHHARNQGKGAAIRTALQYISGDMMIIQDGDLEQDPEDIYRLVEPMLRGGAQVVYGSRFLSQRPRMKKRAYLANRLISGFASLLYGRRITDVETCYKLFKTDLIKSISWEADSFDFEPEITARLLRKGIQIQEVPIKEDWFHGYDNNTKKVTWKDGLKAILTLLKYRFR